MSVDYSSLTVKTTIGGSDDEVEIDGYEDYRLSQSQHVIADQDKYYISMLLKRTFRIIANDKSVTDPDLGFDVGLSAGMCFHGDDEILVADNRENKIVVCKRSDGTFIKDFATSLDLPNGLTTDGESIVIVGEVGDSAKQARCFDFDGNEKFSIKSADSKTFSGINYVSYDKINKRIIISDTDENAVHVFGSDATYQFSISEKGTAPGQLTAPGGTAVDNFGNILVCDTGNDRVQVFDKEGKFLSLFADKEDPFNCPLDIYTKPDNEVVILDGSVMSGWSRLQMFQY